ncbi:response regulator, partial [bacterium]|nr:response regulator [bacterium]
MSKILIVDDERGIRESLDIFLSDEGHAIDTASNGREALFLLKKHNYDLVLTDVRMPDMNGMVLMKEIKEKMRQPVPVIILTAYGTIQSAVTAVKEGASDFILKPFEIEHLRKAVNKALESERKKLEYKLFQQEGKNRYLNLMNQKLDRTVFELAILHEIGKTLNSTLEINKVVSIILEMVRQTVVADKARLFLYNYEKPGLALNVSYSTENAGHTQQNDFLDQDAIDWIIWKGEPVLVDDVKQQGLLKIKHELASNVGALMIIPFKRKSRILGAMLLANRAGGRKFIQEDKQFAVTLANQASISIENT